MTTRRRFGLLIASSLLLLGWSRPAAAGLVLQFDQSSYTINGIGNTTSVEVLITQSSSGPQVGPGNELLTAGIEISYPTGSTAAVLSTADVIGNVPTWDSAAPVLGTSGANTIVDLALTSLLGIANIPSTGLLLGTFVFHGESLGTTSISVASISPGVSFITAQGDDLDPTNTPTAQITVVQSTIPEPSGLVLLGIGSLMLGAGWLRHRTRSAAGSA